jgi:hypothetical protein
MPPAATLSDISDIPLQSGCAISDRIAIDRVRTLNVGSYIVVDQKPFTCGVPSAKRIVSARAPSNGCPAPSIVVLKPIVA